MKNYKNEQSGRSMVEMLGVLAIIGVLSVAGIAGYSKAMAKYKLSKTTDQVSMIVANIRTLYSGQRTYAGLNNKNALSFGVVPNEMAVGGNDSVISNAYSGKVTIVAATPASGVADGAFTITFEGLSRDTCIALSTSDWGSGSSSGLISVIVGGTNYTGANLPVPLTSAAESCNCDDASCTVGWTYF